LPWSSTEQSVESPAHEPKLKIRIIELIAARRKGKGGVYGEKDRIIALIHPDDPLFYDNIQDSEPQLVGKWRRLDPRFVVVLTNRQYFDFVCFEEHSEARDEEEVKNDDTAFGKSARVTSAREQPFLWGVFLAVKIALTIACQLYI